MKEPMFIPIEDLVLQAEIILWRLSKKEEQSNEIK